MGERPAKRFNSGGGGGGPDFSDMMNFMACMQMMQGFQQMTGNNEKGRKGGGKGPKGVSINDDPAGSGRVHVRGFDYFTTEEQIRNHLGSAGPIFQVNMRKGQAVVIFEQRIHAVKASQELNQTTIPGNTRYIDVIYRK